MGQGEKIALRLLSLRWHTKKKLAQKLEMRGIDEPELSAVLERMEHLGYLDDERYGKIWLREKMAQRRWGPARLRLELVRQGLDPTLAEGLIGEAFPPGSGREAELALEVARKKAKQCQDPNWRAKTGSALARWGFRSEVIWRVLDSLEDDNVLDSEEQKD